MLIAFGGLPGTGKTTLSRALALRLEAVHLRIDTIEQAISRSSLAPPSVEEAGYLVGYALALDNLRLGRTVIADSVNALAVTRESWLQAARRAGVEAVEVEVVCSDVDEHRRRVETRASDVPGLRLPSWESVVRREYHAWSTARFVIDTARDDLGQSLAKLRAALGKG